MVDGEFHRASPHSSNGGTQRGLVKAPLTTPLLEPIHYGEGTQRGFIKEPLAFPSLFEPIHHSGQALREKE